MANNDAEMTLLKKTTTDDRYQARKMESIDTKFLLRKRYLVLLLMFLGMALSIQMKVNLSIVLTDIAYPKYVSKGNQTIYQKPQVDWNSLEVGFIIGTVTYGQIPGMLFAGIFAKKYGGAKIFGCGLFALSVLACLTPAVLNASHFWLFIIVRVIEGFVAGSMDVSYCVICFNWSPIEERARYASSVPLSFIFGVICSNIVTGYGIHYSNWETVFFATGGIALILAILWLLLVRSRPCDDRFISDIERRYLEAKILETSDKDLKISSYPWKEIFTSKPVWAYLNEYFCGGWSASFTIYCLPFYIKDVTKLNIKNVALVSSIPTTFSIVSGLIFGYIHDRIRSRKKNDNSNIHRIILMFAHVGVAICLIIMALWVNFEASLVLMAFIRIFLTIEHVYSNIMPIDVFHRYAGLIRSLGSSCLILTNCLTPLLVGIIVTNHERSQWSVFFGIIVVFNIFSVFVFYLYGSFELQPWASPPVGNKEKSQRQ